MPLGCVPLPKAPVIFETLDTLSGFTPEPKRRQKTDSLHTRGTATPDSLLHTGPRTIVDKI